MSKEGKLMRGESGEGVRMCRDSRMRGVEPAMGVKRVSKGYDVEEGEGAALKSVVDRRVAACSPPASDPERRGNRETLYCPATEVWIVVEQMSGGALDDQSA